MSQRVAVIGAGMAGLCALRHLSNDPEQFDPVAFEQTKDIGGVWVYRDSDDDPVDGCLYKTLRTNIPKEIMGFPDLDFSDYEESFLHHSAVRHYLEEYAALYDLTKYVQFQTLVTSIVPANTCSIPTVHDTNETIPNGVQITTNGGACAHDVIDDDNARDGVALNNNGRWHVTVKNLEKQEYSTLHFDAVLICNGLNTVSNIPTFPGQDQFHGEILHSKMYRDPEDYRDKTVVILGASFSGKDILMDLAHVAKKVYISHRSEDKLSFNLPANAEEKPTIINMYTKSIQFQDGDCRKADVLILATGYLLDYPFLSETCKINVKNGRIQSLYKQIFNTHMPTMCFIGITAPVIQFRVTDAQVQYTCAVLRGDVKLPAKIDMLREEEDDFLARAGPEGEGSRMHQLLGQEQWDYVDALANQAGFTCTPHSVRKMFKYLTELFQSDFDNFKSKKFLITDEDSYVCL